MSLGRVQQASGSLVRAESEFNLLRNENSKRIRVDSQLSRARGDELNAIAAEADGNKSTYITKFYDQKAAAAAERAAKAAMYAAIFSAGASITKIFSQGQDALTAVGTIFSAGFSIAGAIISHAGTKAEADMLKQQVGTLSKEVQQDQKMVQALDANGL